MQIEVQLNKINLVSTNIKYECRMSAENEQLFKQMAAIWKSFWLMHPLFKKGLFTFGIWQRYKMAVENAPVSLSTQQYFVL